MREELNELEHGVFYRTCEILKAVVKNALVPIITLLISVSSVLVNSNISKIEQRLTESNVNDPALQEMIKNAYSWEKWLMLLFFALLGLIGLVLLVEIGVSLYESANQVKLKNNVNTVKKSQKSLNGIYKQAQINLKDLRKGKTGAYDDYVALTDVIAKHNRILLQLGMYNLRIKFGKFLVNANKYTDNFEHRIKAYVDYLGWTYILIGQGEKGRRCIEYAVKFLQDALEHETDKQKKFDYNYYLARCYRHLSTTYYSKPYMTDKEITGFMAESRKYVTEMRSLAVDLPAKCQEKITTMLNGIEYNQNLFDYCSLHYGKNMTQKQKQEYFDELCRLRKVLEQNRAESIEIKDYHRLVKDDSLLYSVCESLVTYLRDCCANCTSQEKQKTYALQLSEVEKDMPVYIDEMNEIIGKNIYFDEAMEVYTEEVLDVLEDRLISNDLR